MIRIVSWVLMVLTLASCASNVVLTDLEYPFRLLILAVQDSLPGGARPQSANNREWVSQYFSFEKNRLLTIRNMDSVSERHQAVVQILGDRRPYKISVVVGVEESHKSQGRQTFVHTRDSDEAAEEIAKRIEAFLAQSRERRDLIDEFRAF